MKVMLLSPLKMNGRDYRPGEGVDLPDDTARRMVKHSGAVEWDGTQINLRELRMRQEAGQIPARRERFTVYGAAFTMRK